jgi:hypothetical protein
MKSGWVRAISVAVLGLVGCQEITYTVKITNSSAATTDFSITSINGTPQFISDLAAGHSVTVTHTATAFADVDIVTVNSGTLVGSLLSPIDATCKTRVTAHDTVTVVKGANGQLTCTVQAESGGTVGGGAGIGGGTGSGIGGGAGSGIGGRAQR